MRCFARVALATMLVALAGCSHWQAGPDARFTRWKCAAPSHIEWRFVDDARRTLELRIAGQPGTYRLRQEPTLSGAFYSDGVIGLHLKTGDALAYRLADDRLLARGCTASLITL